MSRKPTFKTHVLKPDYRYDSQLVTMIVNRILRKGKKKSGGTHFLYRNG